MADSESERVRLTSTLSQLEHDKRHLEAENARVIQENKDLLQQLEGMNSQIADSDAHIESLCNTLREAKVENGRLMALAIRAEELERQVGELEGSRGRLVEELGEARDDERCAVERWMGAERRLRGLSEQVERIEKEAGDERERHVEIVARMERRREVEKELESAAGRLKVAAAVSTWGKRRDKDGTNVVSHFVRDILQDNANLQAGIVELRELLQASNEEVQNLREQVLRHQPISSDYHTSQPQIAALSDEIERSKPRTISQEVHVHHHYHAKILAKKESRPTLRRPPRRKGLVSSSSNSSAGCQTPVPVRGSHTMLATPRPPNRGNRWSTQSSATDFSNVSSLPSSPYSDHRSSSLFDRIESGFESSRPTSPESAEFAPRRFQFEKQEPHLELGMRKGTELKDVSEDESPGRYSASSDSRQCGKEGNVESEQRVSPLDPVQRPQSQHTQHPQSSPDLPTPNDELDTMPDHQNTHPLEITSTLDEFYFASPSPSPHSNLHRSSSRESLLSISGMDIHLHLPERRPPPPPLRLLHKPSLNQMDLSIAFPSPQPLASIAEVNASSTRSSDLTFHSSTPNGSCLSPVSLLSGLAKAPPHSGPGQAKGQGLGGLVGSWVKGRWGIAPMASTGRLREEAAFSASVRGPGINQKGPIMGFKPPPTKRAVSDVHARVLDRGLLEEALVE